jgi:MFS family permease
MDNKRFLTWTKPSFNGSVVGLISGLLVIGIIAGLSAAYNYFNQISYIQTGDGQWYYLLFPILFTVFSVALILLAGIALPLMRTWHRGRRTVLTAFIAEVFIFFVGLVILLLIATHMHPNNGQPYNCVSDINVSCCDGDACPAILKPNEL